MTSNKKYKRIFHPQKKKKKKKEKIGKTKSQDLRLKK